MVNIPTDGSIHFSCGHMIGYVPNNYPIIHLTIGIIGLVVPIISRIVEITIPSIINMSIVN